MIRRGKKGLQVTRGERYALVPDEVMRSDAYHALPDFARSVLFALACQYNGRNNGNLSLPAREARDLGVPAQWKVYAGLRLCEWADLIVCTRRGKLEGGTKLPSLFAFTWRGIDDTGTSYDYGVGICPKPSHAWAKWKKPADWLERVRQVQRQMRGTSRGTFSAEIPVTTLSGEGRSTLSGEGKADSTPHCQEKETGFSTPHCRETSKISAVPAEFPISPPAPHSTRASPQGSLARGAASSAQLPPHLISKLMASIQELPHLTDRDHARTFRCESTEVAQVRERLARLQRSH